VVYARSLGDTTLTFIVSGKLWRNGMVMQDLETGSLWSQVTGVAIAGPLAGRRLRTVPSVQTDWREWSTAHPHTRVLRKEEPVTASAYRDYAQDPRRAGLFRADWLRGRLPAKTLVHGLARDGAAVAVTDSLIRARGRLVVALGEHAVTVTRDRDGGVRAHDERGRDVPVHTAYWFAWSTFYPRTSVRDGHS